MPWSLDLPIRVWTDDNSIHRLFTFLFNYFQSYTSITLTSKFIQGIQFSLYDRNRDVIIITIIHTIIFFCNKNFFIFGLTKNLGVDPCIIMHPWHM